MDSVPCRWRGTNGQAKQPFPKPRPIRDTLSRLAVLMARVDHKHEGRSRKSQQSGPSICKTSGQDHGRASDMNNLASQQQKERTLRKPHHCQHCGQEFSLASTLQMHRCLKSSSTCQKCRGKLQRGTTCPSCRAEVQDPHSSEEQPHHFNHRLNKHDSNPYACAPCGKAFTHKQELLYHQQAGGCQPAPRSPSTVIPMSTNDTPTPYCASPPRSPLGTNHNSVICPSCHKTFRSAQGLSSHQRVCHQNSLMKKKKKVTEHARGPKGTLFPCRSCDKVFPQTSLLYRHRKEEHRRKTSTKRQQRNYGKRPQRRQKGETYPCLHCGKVFLHHLTRWAHFKSYSSHYQTHLSNTSKSDKTHKDLKASKDFKTAKGCKLTPRASKKSKPVNKKTNKHVKCLISKARRQEIADKEDAVGQDEDEDGGEEADEVGEFPCPSCEEVFTTKSALLHHEDIHQSTHTPNHCSVCAGGIALPQIAGSSVNRVYHCVPCKEAYVDLETFLQHCQTHFNCSSDDEKDDAPLSD